MGRKNDRMQLGNLKEVDVLRVDNTEIKKRLGLAMTALVSWQARCAQAEKRARTATTALATVLHLSAIETIDLSNDDSFATFEHCWHRVKTEVIKHDNDEPSSLRLTLVPVTDEERLKAAEAEEAAKKKAEADEAAGGTTESGLILP